MKQALQNANEKIYIGAVKYIDYDKEPINATNLLNFIVHKRLSFAHEREVRAVIAYKDLFWQEPCETPGFPVSIDLNCLIQKNYVAPSKQRWFADLVASVVKRYGITAEVIRSTLLDDPCKLPIL